VYIVWVCMCEDNVIGIAGSIMSMYTVSVMVLLVWALRMLLPSYNYY